ncbi:uncharacterized protein LOC109717951 isoform X2 [Ananas comosus]|uniref:Uncharacterized protein LOC109717951 isoform X2 n=1 Tax=Ananas comosus TaxID=4615 RepID=A0A6P5G1H2_ANACO|nr:uncharacterized protein LOC109717951 isoform X2 [Ananas comosus]
MENSKQRRQFPAFGSWNLCDEIPITQYFESAAMFFGSEGDDLFKVVAVTPTKNQFHHEKKGNKGGVMRREEETNKHYKEQKKKPKCVDEDLYKISPELLYKIPKKKRLLRNFWTACLGLNCIA